MVANVGTHMCYYSFLVIRQVLKDMIFLANTHVSKLTLLANIFKIAHAQIFV